jgi:hypothetical protein
MELSLSLQGIPRDLLFSPYPISDTYALFSTLQECSVGRAVLMGDNMELSLSLQGIPHDPHLFTTLLSIPHFRHLCTFFDTAVAIFQKSNRLCLLQ